MIRHAFKITILLVLFSLHSRAQFPQWHNYTTNNGIREFELDGNDIWIASTGGLVKLNKLTGAHINYNAGNFGLTKNDVYRIATDTSGMLFMSGQGYVQTFDKDTSWNFKDTLEVIGNNMPSFAHCVADDLGNIYASQNANFIVRYHNSLYDTLQIPFPWNPTVAGLAVDTNNHLWYASRYFGIATYDGSSWQSFDSTNSILPSQYATGICVDHNNKVYALYYAVPNQGVLYSYSGGTWVQEMSGINILNDIVEMYVDVANNIWITSENGNLNGIRKYDGTNMTSYTAGMNGLPSNKIYEFQIDDQGNWFYATEAGFYSYDGVTHRKYEISNADFPTNWFEKVTIDEHNVKWFGGYYGVTRFDGYNWHTYNVSNSTLSWDHITDIYADHDQGLIWVTFNAGWGSSGIAYFDGSNWNTITPAVSGGFGGGQELTRDANGNMWFLSTAGVAKFDYVNWTYYPFMPTMPHLVADSSGNVYVSVSNQGVWQYNGSSWLLFDSTFFPAPQTSTYYYLNSGPGGQVYAINGSNMFVCDGTTWNIFNPPCAVQNPQTFLPAEASTGELWLSSGQNVSVYNGNSCEELTISRLPDLSGIVESVAKDQHDNYWITYDAGQGGITVYHHDGGIDPETLFDTPTTNASGFIFIDIASDGVYDTLTDIPYANQRVLLLPDSMTHFTNAHGVYNFSVDNGNYSIQVIPDTTWLVTTDSVEYHFSISGMDTAGFDFGMMGSLVPIEQMEIDVTTGVPRCNISFPVWIDYSNQGLSTMDGMIKLSHDNILLVNGSNPPADSSDGTDLFWNITGLTTYQQGTIQLSVELDTFFLPPAVHLIHAEFIKSGLTIANDIILFAGLCSLDPNDKIVSPIGSGPLHEIAPSQNLEYTIRFQNFGNDTAFYVMILDTLDPNLDFSTFEIIGSSHLCEASLNTSGLLTVKFRNINLLWEEISETGSQGYFKYSISPNSNVANNTVIANDAAIYFDFNLPVITNEVFNTISYNFTSVPSQNSRDEIILYPVPAKDELYLSGSESNEIIAYGIFDITGREQRNEIMWKQHQPINVAQLPPGIYLLRLRAISGKLIYSRFVIHR